MHRPPPPSPLARLPRGGVSWVTLVLIALVAGGAYLAWMWGPVYVLHVEVRTVARDYMNRAVRNPDDARLVDDMVHKLRTLDELSVPDDDGTPANVPTVQVAAQDVTWERDVSVSPPMLHVAFEYTRPVQYPLLDRWTTATLSVDFTNDLSRPDWGPAR
jgi:hypothetical protein